MLVGSGQLGVYNGWGRTAGLGAGFGGGLARVLGECCLVLMEFQ